MFLPVKELPLRDIHQWPIPYDNLFGNRQLGAMRLTKADRGCCTRLLVRYRCDLSGNRQQIELAKTTVTKKKRTNPFYFMLIVVGIAFCITATAFGILTLREMRDSRVYQFDLPEQSESEASFMEFVDRNAVRFMVVELALLAVATVGAIGTDSYYASDETDAAAKPESPNVNPSEGK